MLTLFDYGSSGLGRDVSRWIVGHEKSVNVKIGYLSDEILIPHSKVKLKNVS